MCIRDRNIAGHLPTQFWYLLVLGYFVRDRARAFELDRRRREFVACRPHVGQILGDGLSHLAQRIDRAWWEKVHSDGNMFFPFPWVYGNRLSCDHGWTHGGQSKCDNQSLPSFEGTGVHWPKNKELSVRTWFFSLRSFILRTKLEDNSRSRPYTVLQYRRWYILATGSGVIRSSMCSRSFTGPVFVVMFWILCET